MPERASPFLASLADLPGYRSTWLQPEGRQVKLNHNESAEDAPAALKQQALARLAAAPWHRYPDPRASGLRGALAANLGVSGASVVLGNGGNELIGRLFQSLRRDATVLLCSPGYYVYRRAADGLGLASDDVPLVTDAATGAAFTLDAEAVLARARRCACPVLCLAQPNNPTGNLLGQAALDRVFAGFAELSGLIVIDEAYADYSGVSRIGSVATRRDIVILRTFSKAFGLAGIRLGALVAHPQTAATIEKMAPPYAVGLAAQVIGEAALDCVDEVRALARRTVVERERVATALATLPGVHVHPSATNFLLVDLGEHVTAVAAALVADAITVRDLATVPGLRQCLRLTVGSASENDRVIAAVRMAVS